MQHEMIQGTRVSARISHLFSDPKLDALRPRIMRDSLNLHKKYKER